MTWFKVDDGFPEHPKLEPLENDPELWSKCLAVWLAAGCDSSKRLTSGLISGSRLARITPLKGGAIRVAERLCKLQLWEKKEGKNGVEYTFHDWSEYQLSVDEVIEKRAQARERKRKFDQGRREAKKSNAVSNASGNALHTPTPVTRYERSPDPDPDPDLDLDQDLRDHPTPSVSTHGPGVGGVSLPAFAKQLAGAGICIELSRSERERFSKLVPVEQYEIDHAVESARAKHARCGYVLSTIEGERQRAAQLPDQPEAQGPQRRLNQHHQNVKDILDLADAIGRKAQADEQHRATAVPAGFLADGSVVPGNAGGRT